jgi:HSP20 family protein
VYYYIRRIIQINNKEILQYDWFSKFLDLDNNRYLYDRNELFCDFDDSYRGIDSKFSIFNDISTNAPNELVREYGTQEGPKVRRVVDLHLLN